MYTEKLQHIQIKGDTFAVRYLRPTTKIGAEKCVQLCHQAARDSGHAIGTRDSALGLSASVCIDYGDQTPNRPPFSMLQGASGWLRIHLVQPESQFNVLYCRSTLFDDSGRVERFDLFEEFLARVKTTGAISPVSNKVESCFRQHEEQNRNEIANNWRGLRHTLTDGSLRQKGSEIWHVRKKIRQIENRLSELRKELLDLKYSASDDSTVIQEKQLEQSELRDALVELETREMELQDDRSFLKNDPILDWSVWNLLTIRWSIGLQVSAKKRPHLKTK